MHDWNEFRLVISLEFTSVHKKPAETRQVHIFSYFLCSLYSLYKEMFCLESRRRMVEMDGEWQQTQLAPLVDKVE